MDQTLTCDADGVFVAGWGLEADDGTVRSVRINGIDGACFGNALFVRVYDGSGALIGQGSALGTYAGRDDQKIRGQNRAQRSSLVRRSHHAMASGLGGPGNRARNPGRLVGRELSQHVAVVGDTVAPHMAPPDTDPAALHAADSLAVLPEDPAAAADEIQRRREEIGFSYFVFGAVAADTLAPVVAQLTGK